MAADPNKLRGILPPIPTPFEPGGALALDALADNLDAWNQQPLGGYVVGGSNGEFVLLDDDERVAVVRAARDSIPADRWLLAGAGTQSTARTIDLAERMVGAGADALLVLPPSYYRSQMTAQVLEEHFLAVAERASAPVVLYNIPASTGIDIPLETVLALARHPNVIGIKDSGGDITRLGAICQGAPSGFTVLAGSAGFLLGALSVGAAGAVSALANLAGPQLAQLQGHFEAGEQDQARRLQLRLIEPNRAVTARYGVPGLKAALDMIGLYGGPVRGPLRPLGEAERQELRSILARADLVD